jgi:hypothetical protein
MNFLGRSIEPAAVLFDGEFGEVVVNDERKAEPQQENQVRQNATRQ